MTSLAASCLKQLNGLLLAPVFTEDIKKRIHSHEYCSTAFYLVFFVFFFHLGDMVYWFLIASYLLLSIYFHGTEMKVQQLSPFL